MREPEHYILFVNARTLTHTHTDGKLLWRARIIRSVENNHAREKERERELAALCCCAVQVL